MPRNCDKTILEIKTAEKIMAKLLSMVYLPPGFDIVECPKQQPHGQKGAGRQDQQQYGLRSRQCYGMSEQGTGSENSRQAPIALRASVKPIPIPTAS